MFCCSLSLEFDNKFYDNTDSTLSLSFYHSFTRLDSNPHILSLSLSLRTLDEVVLLHIPSGAGRCTPCQMPFRIFLPRNQTKAWQQIKKTVSNEWNNIVTVYCVSFQKVQEKSRLLYVLTWFYVISCRNHEFSLFIC